MADALNTLDTNQPVQPNQLAQSIDGLKTEDGENFVASDLVKGLAAATAQDWLIITGAQPIGIRSAVSVEGKSEFEVYEGTTVSANGSPITLVDSNRITANTPLTVVYNSPTVTTVGTLISTGLLQAGEKQRVVTSTAQGDRFILAANTNYLIRVTNTSGGAIDLSIAIDFNEPA